MSEADGRGPIQVTGPRPSCCFFGHLGRQDYCVLLWISSIHWAAALEDL